MGMSRKEAIENLKEFIDTYITCHGEEDTIAVSLDNVDVEAFDMAIKALEPCEDAISRKAVLDMAKSYNTDGWDMYTPLVVDVEDIEELPSVTPIRPKGHWKTDRQGDIQCSRCGHQRPYFIDYTSEGCKVRGELTPYCPMCGSDNREVGE